MSARADQVNIEATVGDSHPRVAKIAGGHILYIGDLAENVLKEAAWTSDATASPADRIQTGGGIFAVRWIYRPLSDMIRVSRVLKSKHQAVSQGARGFGTRSIFSDM
jgi:hypothetical protein